MMVMITLHFPRKKQPFILIILVMLLFFLRHQKKRKKIGEKNYQRQKQNARTNAMCFFRLGSIFLVSPITIYSQKNVYEKTFTFT